MEGCNDGVSKTKQKMDVKKEAQNFKELAAELEVFSSAKRIAILKFLKVKGERPVGTIADNIKTSFGTTSKHLLFLTKNKILARRYDGPFVLYSISKNLSKPAQVIISKII